MKTKLLAILLALIMCFGALPLSASAANIASGGFGEYGSGSWVIDANGNLTISGEVGLGGNYDLAPWNGYRKSIKKVSFTSGSHVKEGASLSYMFWDCSSITSIDFSYFDTSSATDMYGMFMHCSSLDILNLSNFDTSSVTDMASMFNNCSALEVLNIRSFDTSSVSDMSYMFENCSSLWELDLSSFNISRVSHMEGMFENCGRLLSYGDPAPGYARNAGECERYNNSAVTGINASKLKFKAAKSISNISVTGITPPIANLTASVDLSFPANEHYVDNSNDYAYWIETDSEPKTAADLYSGKMYHYDDELIFDEDKYYTFRVDFDAVGDYIFLNSCTAKINGNKANVILNTRYAIVWYCFGKAPYVKCYEVKSLPSTTINYKSTVSTDGLKVVAVLSNGNEIDITDKAKIDEYSSDHIGNSVAYVVVEPIEGFFDFEYPAGEFDYTVKYTWWQWIIRILLLGFLWY